MPPNVVLIMSDQHNPRIMGCCGDPITRTPNLDALAERGVRLTNMYTPSPLCLPARMSFMTGQYPSDINVFGNGSVLASDIPTFAHGLGAVGYETVLCGRMHFAGPDQFHGFEKRILGDCQWSEVLSHQIKGSGFNRTNGQTKYAVEVAGYGKTGYQAFDRRVADTACEYLRRRGDDERPYCLVVGMMLPHNPMICERELFDHYMQALPQPQPPSVEYLERLHPAMKRWRQRRGIDDLTGVQNHRGLAAYYGLVEELDRNVGRVIDAVHQSGSADRTAIIYCSDHGDMACQHGMWWKTSFYDGSVRVPCIVSWPGELPCDTTCGAVVSLIDLGPTILDWATCEPLPDAIGRSVACLLRHPQDFGNWPNEVFAEILGAHGDQPSCMIRSGPWKLIYFEETQSYQLFNLEDDPDEICDRQGDPTTRAVAKRMLANIRRRWSASDRLNRVQRAARATTFINRCSYALIPHSVEHFRATDQDNQFDFAQLPLPPQSHTQNTSG